MKHIVNIILSIALSILPAVSSGMPIKSLLAQKKFVEEGKVAIPTAADYIQDGLVAMFDGIENVGWGMHDSSSTVWVDLMENSGNAILGGAAVWTDNSLMNSSAVGLVYTTSAYFSIQPPLNYLTAIKENKEITVEFVCRIGVNRTGGRCYGPQIYNASSRYASCNIQNSDSPTFVELNGYYLYMGFRNRLYSENSSSYPKYSSAYTFVNVAVAETNETTYVAYGFRNGNYINEYPYDKIGFDFHSNYLTRVSDCTTYHTVYALRFYCRALTEDEIKYNYLIDKLRFNLR